MADCVGKTVTRRTVVPLAFPQPRSVRLPDTA